jgi:hypothetical protein
MVAQCESLNGSNSSDSPHHCHATAFAALDILRRRFDKLKGVP